MKNKKYQTQNLSLQEMRRYVNIKCMEILKNQLHSVLIESYSSEGFGVCRIGGRAVFVPRAVQSWNVVGAV